MKSIVNKPWGSYRIIDQGECFLVKNIVVKPYCKLSLQSHKHRSEHWIIVEGRAEVTINDNITTLETNQSTFIPSETKHRLSENLYLDIMPFYLGGVNFDLYRDLSATGWYYLTGNFRCQQ